MRASFRTEVAGAFLLQSGDCPVAVEVVVKS